MLGFVCASLLAFACSGPPDAPAPEPEPDSLREITQGSVLGREGLYGGHAWLGVPFARPPVGPLRWKSPQAPEPWTGTRETLSFGESCVQFASALGGRTDAEPGTLVGDEDCLSLNIYAPRFGPTEVPEGDARLPVMVWIHGGGNTIGTSAFYDGSNLATRHDVIVVSVNYRLGALGWFRHPALADAEASAADRSGNFGTLDLVRSLEWVRDNIAAFGGDPGNVTIFGESAGGANVFSLLVSPSAEGLFHRAIAQSGSPRAVPVAAASHWADDPMPGDATSAVEVAARLLVEDGSAADRNAARARLEQQPAPETAAYLRGKTPGDLMAAYDVSSSGMFEMPKLFMDGAVLPAQPPMQSFEAGAYHRVPVLLGTNRDENKLFMALDPRFARSILGIPWIRDAEQFDRVASYQSRLWKARGADEPARAMARAQGSSVYVYRFDWDEEPRILWVDLGRSLGAAHGFEIPFVFGHFELGRLGNALFDEENEPGRRELAGTMMSYWSEFAYRGDPGRGREGKAFPWTAFDDSEENSDRFLILDTEAGGGLRMASEFVSTERVLADLRSDAGIGSLAARCEIAADLVRWSREQVTVADYTALGCGALPIARR